MGGWDFQESGYYGPLPPKAPPKEAAPEYNITLGVIDGSIVDLDTMDTIKTRWHLG